MKDEKEIRKMLELVQNDIEKYKVLHKDFTNKKYKNPFYNNEVKRSLQIFKGQEQILRWILEELK